MHINDFSNIIFTNNINLDALGPKEKVRFIQLNQIVQNHENLSPLLKAEFGQLLATALKLSSLNLTGNMEATKTQQFSTLADKYVEWINLGNQSGKENASTWKVTRATSPRFSSTIIGSSRASSKMHKLSPALKEKFVRAFDKTKQIYKGTAQGAKPMTDFYRGEVLDLKSRYGRMFKPYFDAWKKAETGDSFNEWMSKLERGEKVAGSEGLDIENLKQIPRVIYLDENQRKNYVLQVQNGKVITPHEGILNTPPSHGEKEPPHHIFAVGPDNKIYAAIYKRGTLNHSSFLSGGAVKGAGQMFVTDGKITLLTDKSGHYTPMIDSENFGVDKTMMYHTIKAMLAQGFDLTGTEVKVGAMTKNPINMKALDYLKEYEPEYFKEQMKKDVRNHGPMNRESSEKFLSEFRVGAALLRWSDSQKDFVISKKIGNNKYLHFLSKGKSLKEFMKQAEVRILIAPEITLKR